MERETRIKEVLLYNADISSTYYGNRTTLKNIPLTNVIKSLQAFDKSVKVNAKEIGTELFYNIRLWNKTYSIETLFKKANITFLVKSLKKLDGQITTNVKNGNEVQGQSKNSKNTKTSPNMTLI